MISNRRHRPARRRRGFTLLEMIIVVAIIAMIAGIGIVAVGGALTGSQEVTARAQMQQIETGLQMYRVRHGNYPKTNQGLQVLVNEGILKQLPKDPWGNAYEYRFPAKENTRKGSFDLWTIGSDPESKEDDIGNWMPTN